MSTESQQAYAEYRRLKAEFDVVGIPWNQKGSPHRLLIAAKRELAKVGFGELVTFTMKSHIQQMVANITMNNALLHRLTHRAGV